MEFREEAERKINDLEENLAVHQNQVQINDFHRLVHRLLFPDK